MPKDDIKDLYEKAELHLKARRPARQNTIVDGAPPPAALSAPKPMAVPPRPTPRAPAEEPELFSEPEASAHTPLPSHFPSSEAPTAAFGAQARKRQAERRQAPAKPEREETPSIHAPLSTEDHARAKKARTWDPPDWLVAIAKWVAPPIMLCLMAGAYWFQAKVALVNEQTQALSDIRKQKDAAYEKMKKDAAELEEKLGLAQRDRDAYRSAAERWEFLYKQGALKVKTSQDKPGD